jgi:hypothetical protein
VLLVAALAWGYGELRGSAAGTGTTGTTGTTATDSRGSSPVPVMASSVSSPVFPSVPSRGTQDPEATRAVAAVSKEEMAMAPPHAAALVRGPLSKELPSERVASRERERRGGDQGSGLRPSDGDGRGSMGVGGEAARTKGAAKKPSVGASKPALPLD